MAKKITEFNKQTLDVARKAINDKLAELKEEFGLVCKVGNISFSADSFEAKLDVATEEAGDQFEREYNLQAKHGLIPEGLMGKEFKIGVNTFKFRGIKPRARKDVIIVEGLGNKQGIYRLDKLEVLRRLGLEEDINNIKPQRA